MNQPDDRDYYAARATTSRDLAQRATDPAIASIHIDFANRYDILAARPSTEVDGISADPATDNQAT